jgi:hypothetical protein
VVANFQHAEIGDVVAGLRNAIAAVVTL